MVLQSETASIFGKDYDENDFCSYSKVMRAGTS